MLSRKTFPRVAIRRVMRAPILTAVDVGTMVQDWVRYQSDNRDYVRIAGLVCGVVLRSGHILHHASIVRNKARLRALLRIGEWISGAVTETANPDLFIAQVEGMLAGCLKRA